MSDDILKFIDEIDQEPVVNPFEPSAIPSELSVSSSPNSIPVPVPISSIQNDPMLPHQEQFIQSFQPVQSIESITAALDELHQSYYAPAPVPTPTPTPIRSPIPIPSTIPSTSGPIDSFPPSNLSENMILSPSLPPPPPPPPRLQSHLVHRIGNPKLLGSRYVSAMGAISENVELTNEGVEERKDQDRQDHQDHQDNDENEFKYDKKKIKNENENENQPTSRNKNPNRTSLKVARCLRKCYCRVVCEVCVLLIIVLVLSSAMAIFIHHTPVPSTQPTESSNPTIINSNVNVDANSNEITPPTLNDDPVICKPYTPYDKRHDTINNVAERMEYYFSESKHSNEDCISSLEIGENFHHVVLLRRPGTPYNEGLGPEFLHMIEPKIQVHDIIVTGHNLENTQYEQYEAMTICKPDPPRYTRQTRYYYALLTYIQWPEMTETSQLIYDQEAACLQHYDDICTGKLTCHGVAPR